jgi:hypothetical protein
MMPDLAESVEVPVTPGNRSRSPVFNEREGIATASDPSGKAGHCRSRSGWRVARPMHHGTYFSPPVN